jgi:crotonobetainyl-CoA:carnitine CoA-transferase CaiB-like acyl-CoA transferase
MCTRLLADLGADVLRVETGKRADTPWRSASEPDLGRTLAYVMIHRGKRSITIDLKSPAGIEVARSLADVADVVVENFSAGVMARLGLDHSRLASRNPGLIFLSMSGYGHEGPRKDWTSMNSNLQAYSGMMTLTEQEENPPVAVSNSWMDYVGGLHGCFSVLQALSKRKRDGKGRNIDLAQFESGVATMGSLLLTGIVDRALPPRLGNRSTKVAPQGCYQCAGDDQWCVISVENDRQWHALAEILGQETWANGARFRDVTGRMRHHDEIDQHIERWTRTLAPSDVEQRLHAVDIPAQHMRRVNEILDNNSIKSSSVFHLQPGRSKQTLLTGLPFSFSPPRRQEFGPAPRLGEHTEEALKQWLNLDPAEILRLRDAGALV